jgi:hypothetical protein
MGIKLRGSKALSVFFIFKVPFKPHTLLVLLEIREESVEPKGIRLHLIFLKLHRIGPAVRPLLLVAGGAREALVWLETVLFAGNNPPSFRKGMSWFREHFSIVQETYVMAREHSSIVH